MLLAVIVQALLPAGYMPSSDKNGKIALVICSGVGEKTILVDQDSYGAGNQHHNDHPNKDAPACPYFLTQTLSLTPFFQLPNLSYVHHDQAWVTPPQDVKKSFYLPVPPARGPPVLRLS